MLTLAVSVYVPNAASLSLFDPQSGLLILTGAPAELGNAQKPPPGNCMLARSKRFEQTEETKQGPICTTNRQIKPTQATRHHSAHISQNYRTRIRIQQSQNLLKCRRLKTSLGQRKNLLRKEKKGRKILLRISHTQQKNTRRWSLRVSCTAAIWSCQSLCFALFFCWVWLVTRPLHSLPRRLAVRTGTGRSTSLFGVKKTGHLIFYHSYDTITCVTDIWVTGMVFYISLIS